jgi:hypothetical protein
MFAWLAGLAASFFTASIARYLAWKAVAVLLVTTILPVVIKNLIDWLVAGVLSLVTSYVSGSGMSGYTLALTGLAGWLGNVLQLSAALAIILAAVTFRISLRLIPFVGRAV